MTDIACLIERSRSLLGGARFMTLATVSPKGEPWASTVNYVCLSEPLKLVWYSMRDASHSHNIETQAEVAGTIFRCDLGADSPIGLDGGQFTGRCRAIDSPEIGDVHRHYYEQNFPDAVVRQQWALPVEQFHSEGERRFYELEIKCWWLFDIDRWLKDKQDRRIEVPTELLAAAWRSTDL